MSTKGKGKEDEVKFEKPNDNQGTAESGTQAQQNADANEPLLNAEAAEEDHIKDETALLLEKLTLEKAEYLQLAQHLQADFENYRKRSQKIIAESVEDGRRETLKAVLPVADNLQLCVDSASDNDPFVQGVQKTLKQLNDVFSSMGVEEIVALGEPFDPNLHDAVMQMQVEGEKGGKVVEVLRKGYKLNGKVLRHSMVRVSL
ncbi:MAG: nucleotide exchange factor GrpE [Christensenellales bacterium]